MNTQATITGIGQVLTMPLFFAINAIYPLTIMPNWLHKVAACNPLTYQVDTLRYLMIEHATSALGLEADFAVQVVALVIFTAVATKSYPRIID